MSRKQVLVCSPRLPEFDRECGSKRVFDLIEILRDDWAVTFVAQTISNADRRYVRMLQRRGVAVYSIAHDGIEPVVQRGGFDVAILSFWQTAEAVLPALRRLSPRTRVIVDSQDLHFLRIARQGLRRGSAQESARSLNEQYASEMIREINCYAAADAVLAVSDKESTMINDFAADSDLTHTVPLCQDAPETSPAFDERNGILFVGNFWHRPNVEAVEYLCQEIIPKLAPALLAEHPVYIVGNQLSDQIRRLADGLPNVHMVGWVPSLDPYLRRARVSAVPLLHGAGTKGKVIQSLMCGLPLVTTDIGAEGLNITHQKHALIANDPQVFADSIFQLLKKRSLWERLQCAGREHIVKAHGRETVKARLAGVIEHVRQRPPIPAAATPAAQPQRAPYQTLVEQVRGLVARRLPQEATVLVVSKGDPELLKLGGRRAWHFPQTEDGTYAGHHPRDSASALQALEALRRKGAEFLLIPGTAFWWLEHYEAFREHLSIKCSEVIRDEACIVYSLSEDLAGGTAPQVERAPAANGASGVVAGGVLPDPKIIEQFRPRLPERLKQDFQELTADTKRVLVLGIYMANKLNNSDDTIAVLAQRTRHEVTQRWIGLGGTPPSRRIADATSRTILDRVPKFELLNQLMEEEQLDQYDYVLLVDDDVVLPNRFVDNFISLQAKLDFSIAQPARTANSYTDHPIVEQQHGVLARQTLFVEIGPVVSFHRSAYDMVFPFDTSNPMGWGYENVWAHLLRERRMKMGIIDAFPVDHSLRRPVAHYSWAEADAQRASYFRKHTHLPYDECFRVLDVVSF